MREAGEVCYADVDKNGGGTGVVEFQHKDDMKYALKNLDDTKFKSHEVRVVSKAWEPNSESCGSPTFRPHPRS